MFPWSKTSSLSLIHQLPSQPSAPPTSKVPKRTTDTDVSSARNGNHSRQSIPPPEPSPRNTSGSNGMRSRERSTQSANATLKKNHVPPSSTVAVSTNTRPTRPKRSRMELHHAPISVDDDDDNLPSRGRGGIEDYDLSPDLDIHLEVDHFIQKKAKEPITESPSTLRSSSRKQPSLNDSHTPSAAMVTRLDPDDLSLLHKFQNSAIQDSLSKTQIDAVSRILGKHRMHTLVLGQAGTGKTKIIKIICEIMDAFGVPYAIMVPTGIAGADIDGRTIHSWFSLKPTFRHHTEFNPRRHLADITKEKNAEGYARLQFLKRCHTLIVDEISMVDKDLFVTMDELMKTLRKNLQRFGGARVVIFGDFMQLPPVRSSSDGYGEQYNKYQSGVMGGGSVSGDTRAISCFQSHYDRHHRKDSVHVSTIQHSTGAWKHYTSSSKESTSNQRQPQITNPLFASHSAEQMESPPTTFQRPDLPEYGFVFELDWWHFLFERESIFVLTENFRQNDPQLRSILDELCMGVLSPANRKLLASRIGVVPNNPSGVVPTKLFPRKKIVEEMNMKENEKLPASTERVYHADICGPNGERDARTLSLGHKALKESVIPDVLHIRTGSQLVCLVNQTIKRKSGNIQLFNGLRGIVVGFASKKVQHLEASSLTNADHLSQFHILPLVLFNGMSRPIKLAPHKWKRKEMTRKIYITQLPYMLAWSMTVHKAQGMTIEQLSLDIGHTSGIFDPEYPLTYVSLSRGVSLNNIYIQTLNFDAIGVNPAALEYTTSVYRLLGIPYKSRSSVTEGESKWGASDDDSAMDLSGMASRLQIHEEDEYDAYLYDHPEIRPIGLRDFHF